MAASSTLAASCLQPEFVRAAAKFGATIIPFSAVGLDDNLIMLADSTDLERLPFIGQSLARNSRSLPQARRGVTGGRGCTGSALAAAAAAARGGWRVACMLGASTPVLLSAS